MRMINEDEHNVHELTEEIRQDQVICAKTLKLCNSAIFAGKRKIESLDHALTFLGFNNLARLVISTSMGSFYGCSSAGYSLATNTGNGDSLCVCVCRVVTLNVYWQTGPNMHIWVYRVSQH